jgi:hypothetical protein
VQRTVTRDRAAPVVTCGEEEAREARNALGFLEEQTGGTVHRGREQMEMRQSWWVLVGKVLPGATEEDARLDPAHRRGG